MEQEDRATAKTREGIVVSSSMDKTVVVAVKRTVRHARYRKYRTMATKYLAHDERNECHRERSCIRQHAEHGGAKWPGTEQRQEEHRSHATREVPRHGALAHRLRSDRSDRGPAE